MKNEIIFQVHFLFIAQEWDQRDVQGVSVDNVTSGILIADALTMSTI